VKKYKSETRLLVRRFRYHQLSFPTCIFYLDAALAPFIPRMQQGDVDELRVVMLANNEAVMKEVAQRDNPFAK
jgi:hypothetical protein